MEILRRSAPQNDIAVLILHTDPSAIADESLGAEVSYENELVEGLVSGETVRATLKRFGMKWTRAKHWINRPDPDYERKSDHFRVNRFNLIVLHRCAALVVLARRQA